MSVWVDLYRRGSSKKWKPQLSLGCRCKLMEAITNEEEDLINLSDEAESEIPISKRKRFIDSDYEDDYDYDYGYDYDYDYEDEQGFNLILDKSNINITSKLAAAIAAPSVVSVVSRQVPVDMVHLISSLDSEQEVVFWGSGTIIECKEDVVTHTFLTTIITVASLFKRNNGVEPHQIKVDVFVSKDANEIIDGQVLACDFHNNLAAIRIHTKFQLQTATLRALYDVFPIRPTKQQLLPYSNLFKILPETNIIGLLRSSVPHNSLYTSPAVFEDNLDFGLECNELYLLRDHKIREYLCGGPVINYDGEVIGIAFDAYAFLPSNIISRWWEHFKSSRKYCRPWLGMKVANLYSSRLEFLENFMMKFPDINTGVIVTKAAEDSPAYCSGIRPEDVIVECNGKLVCSKLELFDIIWDKVGENVEVTVLRASTDGQKLKLSLTIGETTPDNFYKWPQTSFKVLPI